MGYLLELRPSLGAALVVGGGAVAARKVRGLVAGGFAVTVVAPNIDEAIIEAAGVTAVHRAFQASDVAGHALVFACTNDRAVNEAVGRAARAARVPVVVADSQDESTAFTPAVYRDGAFTVAVSTGGGAPRVAAEIRDEIAEVLGPGVGARVEGAARARRTVLSRDIDDAADD